VAAKPPAMPKDTADQANHRKRLRELFLNGGADALPNYKMLELLSFGAQPRLDIKPLAKRLLMRFGSFSKVISAEPRALKEVEGIGDSAVIALKTVQAAALRLARKEVLEKPVLGNWNKLLAYCRASMGFAKNERFRVLSLNRQNILLADEVQQEGTVDHTPVYPREVVTRASELGTTAIITVHKHPSGDLTPSKSDIGMTREVMEAGARLGIQPNDHLIMSKAGHASSKEMGLL